MEKNCVFPSCHSKTAFLCKCKSPAVFICDSHFSAHIKQKGLNHQYEFISLPSQSENAGIRFKSPSKNEEIKKILENLPDSLKKSMFPSMPVQSPKSSLISSLPKTSGKLELNEKIFHSSEEFYEGELENGREHGQGKYFGLWKGEKLEYNGEWRHGLPHGKGELVWNNLRLNGSWYQGSLTGDGELELLGGDKFVGEFFEGKFNGNGIYTFADGTEVKTYFKDHFFYDENGFTCVNRELLKSFEGLKEKDPGIVRRFQVICEIFTNPLKKYQDQATTIQNCFFFKNNSLQVIKIDTESLEKSEISIETSQRFPNLGGICEIDSLLFQAGGLIGEKYTGLTFVFNPETLEMRWLESCYKRSAPCALPLHQKVYLFGGADAFLNFIKDNQVFSFETLAWSSLPPLPTASDGMAGGVVGKFLVISGYLLVKVLVFDVDLQVFADCFELPDFKDKVFCVDHGCAFLMCNKKLYESKVGNPFEWKVVRDVVFHSGWPVGMPVRRNGCFFWYTSDKEVWKFDRSTKGLFLLKKFK
jgi:hypothetical protein